MKLFITLFLILLTFQYGQSQEYKPFNFDSGEWCCMYDTKGGMFGDVYHGTHYAIDSIEFYCDGDTIVNAFLFKKLMYRGYTSSQIVPRTFISGYYGAIRNDTLNKKVYFISVRCDSNYAGTGDLLYDFDLNIGDSIQIISCDLLYKETITQIDSILYCNEYYRKYNTSSGYYIVEGIGSKKGLLPVNCFTNQGMLFCYKENDNELCSDCGFMTSIDSYSVNHLKIFPNPTSYEVQIISDLHIRYVEVFDINGILLDRFNSDCEKIVLRKKGCYLIQIHTDNGIITKKQIRE
jgi:hypothetical protein